jgi:hypothetical protein
VTRRPGFRRTATAAALVAVLLGSGACTGDESSQDSPDEPSEETVQEAPEVQLTTRVGVVTGKLQPPRRKALAGRVGKIVDAWFDAAYLDGDYPRTGFADAFPGFTRDAAALARRDRDLLTNARLGPRIDGVEALRKSVRVDLLSPGRHPVGATARFRLAFRTSGDLERRVVVTGRLMLAKSQAGVWKVFAYDVRRSAGATRRSGE